MTPLSHSPLPLRSPIRLPNPSFGEDDFGMLVAGIENMGSIDSIESVEDLVDGIDRQDVVSVGGGQSRRNSYFMSSEKVEAASRAAAAVLSGHQQGGGNRPCAVTVAGSAATTRSSSAFAASAAELLETTAQSIMETTNGGSNESIVISSPSGHSRENCSNMSRPHSPESFLLDDSLLDPKTNLLRNSYDLSHNHSFAITPGRSDTTNCHAYNNNNNNNPSASPIAMSLDWEYANMDHFFDDMATSSTGGSGGGVSGSRHGSDVGRKRKSNVLGSSSIDSKDDHDHGHEKRSNKLSLYNNDSFAQFGAVSGPIASFGVFGSLSNSSTDLPENHHDNTMEQQQNQHDDTMMEQHQPSFVANTKTTLLSPSNRLSSPQRSSSQQRTLPISITNEHSHPTKGTLEHYDPALYHQLKATQPPSPIEHPPLLVPRDRAGNRLAIIRGSKNHHSDFEIDDCVSSKTYLFYKFLREIYPALEGCRYLLPGLSSSQSSGNRRSLKEMHSEDEMECAIHVSEFGSFRLGHVPGMMRSDKSKLTKSELAIAKQRIECAIYAFGGSVSRKQQPVVRQPQSDKLSIFRTRNESSSSNTTTPSSKSSSQEGCSGKKKNKQLTRSNSLARHEKYETKLHQQYFEHGNRLSWDVQANLSLTLNGAKTFDDDDSPLKKSGSGSMDQQQQRKNRCKKCGQIKQGHVCPYQSSLQRSIGVMVYPSANAHVADEPGMLAPALCEMNNFISIRSCSFEGGSGIMPNDENKRQKTAVVVFTIDDEHDLPKKKVARTTGNASISDRSLFRRNSICATPTITCGVVIDDKRSDEEEGRDDNTKTTEEQQQQQEYPTPDLLFQPKMEITLDQYRAITPKNDSPLSSPPTSKRDYTYPQVPLTFTQRKSMSDALFSLSKLVPKLTEECALVLTEARKRDEWDLAVAELMTQVICVLHCSGERDYGLEGLRRYLMGLGIVC